MNAELSCPQAPTSLPRTRTTSLWLFSPRVDLFAFLGSAIISLLALSLGARLGVLNDDSPDWTWIPFVLLIDVAHVYATAFRVYFDTDELKRRKRLYSVVPLVGFAIGVLLYSQGELFFWRALAYMAVFHFVRQQYGWVALYRARLHETDFSGKVIDSFAIYSATLYPLVYWHAHLPRRFWWFMEDDFWKFPTFVAGALWPIYISVLLIYALRSLYRLIVHGNMNPGKDLVVATTALCWYLGIIAFNSAYALTITTVVIHGVPYMVLVYWYASQRRRHAANTYRILTRGPIVFLLTIWLMAYFEEMLWDRGVWHEHGSLFGSAWDLQTIKIWLVPLLALPQLTHYVLDGFIWRRKNNPSFTLL